jgi:hypothetical protein
MNLYKGLGEGQWHVEAGKERIPRDKRIKMCYIYTHEDGNMKPIKNV